MVIKHSKGLKIQINFEINRVYIFFLKKSPKYTKVELVRVPQQPCVMVPHTVQAINT